MRQARRYGTASHRARATFANAQSGCACGPQVRPRGTQETSSATSPAMRPRTGVPARAAPSVGLRRSVRGGDACIGQPLVSIVSDPAGMAAAVRLLLSAAIGQPEHAARARFGTRSHGPGDDRSRAHGSSHSHRRPLGYHRPRRPTRPPATKQGGGEASWPRKSCARTASTSMRSPAGSARTAARTARATSRRGMFSGEVGSLRLLRLFERFGIKTTWFIPAHSIETFPEQMKAVAAGRPRDRHARLFPREPDRHDARAGGGDLRQVHRGASPTCAASRPAATSRRGGSSAPRPTSCCWPRASSTTIR